MMRWRKVLSFLSLLRRYLKSKVGGKMCRRHVSGGSVPSQAEQVLNWHTRNATVQNRVLHSIDQKIDKVSHHVSQQDNQLQHLDSTLRNMYTDLQSRVSRLDVDLHQYISQGYFSPDFDNKEREIRRLKDQLDQITRDHFVSTPYLPSPHPYSPSLIFPTQSPPPPLRHPDHSQFFRSTGDLFRKYPPLSTEKPSTSKDRKTSHKKKTHSSHKHSPPNHQKHAFYTSSRQPYSSNTSSTETETTEPSSTSSWETYHSDQTPDSSNYSDPDDPTRIYLATRADPQPSTQTMDTSSESSAETTEAPPVADEPPDQRDRAQTHTPLPKPTNGPWFNFDEVAPRQWRKRMSEMSAWLDLQIAKGGDNTESILREFVSRFTGSLRDWYQALGEYRQLQLVRCGSVSIATGIIFREFLGDVSQFYKQTRQEFFEMTLTSFMVLDSDDSSSSEQSSLPDHDYPSEAYQATNKENSGPQIKIQILPTKYSKPIPVIAYFDTGAHSSMMNPSVLPAEAWKQENNQFLAADGQIFNTHLVSKHKIGLQFFPSFTLWTHVIGTPLPDKDILIGWDIYSQSKSIRILPQAPQTPQIPPTFLPEFIDTLSPGQTHTIQQIQAFANLYLPQYLSQINSQGCHHQITNLKKPFLDPFISPPFYYYSDQMLWFLWCLSVLHRHAMVFPLQALYGFVQSPTSVNLRTFLQWFKPLHAWQTELTKLMGQYHLWKMDPNQASKVCCIWIFSRPYSYNPHTQLLWTSNICYEWDTSYDYERLYRTNIQIPLLNFLCDVNNDYKNVIFILHNVPRDPTRSLHPLPDSFLQDSQDQADKWPCSICGALNSDDEYHSTCNLSSP
ncbi:hypothetical protein Ddye_004769 [Dipteronia dyeriana]|uniref:Retrotransposon gag domain-containing protein n=1 Tax=Dipteronia dyeriana TaxID=168575 RepID=A0AAD9XFG6_9ROSI|nr:hypothetical protein Ddye_004769 [Dipteronia dyeriana]